MKKGTIEIIKVLVAVVLIAGIGVGLFFGVRWTIDKIGDIFASDPTVDGNGLTKLPTGNETEPPTGNETEPPSDSGNSTQKPEESTLTFYINSETNCGYSTVGNVTFFFKEMKPETVFVESLGTAKECSYMTFYINNPYEDNSINSYGKYDLNIRYSYDGQLWAKPLPHFYGGDYDSNQIHVFPKCYVSYTEVTDCEDPLSVLEDLTINVFTMPNMFGYKMEYVGG